MKSVHSQKLTNFKNKKQFQNKSYNPKQNKSNKEFWINWAQFEQSRISVAWEQGKATGGQKSVVIIRLCNAQARTNKVNNASGHDKYGCKAERKLDVR